MSAIDNIIYQSVVYLAPVLLCVLGGNFREEIRDAIAGQCLYHT